MVGITVVVKVRVRVQCNEPRTVVGAVGDHDGAVEAEARCERCVEHRHTQRAVLEATAVPAHAHTRTRACTHTCTRARTHARTHAPTHAHARARKRRAHTRP
eukprot:559515-Pleurochrysis_carterae.AAC.1